jgi:hypothetical protein
VLLEQWLGAGGVERWRMWLARLGRWGEVTRLEELRAGAVERGWVFVWAWAIT